MGISDDIIKRITDALNAGIDRPTINVVAQNTAKSIKNRTRLGKGVAKTGDKLQSLDPLVSGYKTKRKNLRKNGKLSDETTPSKSNLTKSGEMLDNIKFKTTKDGFEIYISGDNNKEKAKHVQAKRPFMNLASFEIKLIVEKIINRIVRFK